jgi:hypothetical protein
MVVVVVLRGGAAFAVRVVSSEVKADPFMSCFLVVVVVVVVKGSSGSNGAVSCRVRLALKPVQMCFGARRVRGQATGLCGVNRKDVYAPLIIRAMGDAPCLGACRGPNSAKPYLEP